MNICKKDNADIIQYIKEKKEEITKKNKNSNELNKSNSCDLLKGIYISNENVEKLKNLRIQYNMYKMFIYIKLHKKEYKTVLNQIEGNYQIYENLPESKEMLFLKIETLIKIIIQKINKYSIEKIKLTSISSNESNRFKSYSFSKNSMKLLKDISRRKSICNIKQKEIQLSNINIAISIEKYYSKINKEIKDLTEQISNFYQNSQIIYIEKIIQLYLKELLIKYYHHEKLFQYLYSNYYLSLGKKLIIYFKDYIKDTYTLKLSQYIYLIIAKQLFENKEYKKCEIYCIKVYNFCFRELIFKYGDMNLIPENLSSKEKKVFINLSLALLYIGFCKEEKGKIKRSLKYYKLCLFICTKFLINDYSLFSNFVNNIILRTENYRELYLGLKKKGIVYLKGNYLHSNEKTTNLREKSLMSYKIIKNSLHQIKLMKKNQGLFNYINNNSKNNIKKKENDIKEEEIIKQDEKIKIKTKKIKIKNKIKYNNETNFNKSYNTLNEKKISKEISDKTRNINNIQSIDIFKSEKKKSKSKRIMNAISKAKELKKISSCPNLYAIDDTFKSSFITFSIKKLINNQSKSYLSFSDYCNIISNQKKSINNKKNILSQFFIKKLYLDNIRKNNIDLTEKILKNEKFLFPDKKYIIHKFPINNNLSNNNTNFINTLSHISERSIKKPFKRIFSYESEIEKLNKNYTPFSNSINNLEK